VRRTALLWPGLVFVTVLATSLQPPPRSTLDTTLRTSRRATTSAQRCDECSHLKGVRELKLVVRISPGIVVWTSLTTPGLSRFDSMQRRAGSRRDHARVVTGPVWIGLRTQRADQLPPRTGQSWDRADLRPLSCAGAPSAHEQAHPLEC
jgi:hypothetical protein